MRATLGQGDVKVRQDTNTGNDSTAGLNRDLDKAYEITRDRDDRTELYITGASVDALSKPGETLEQWSHNLLNYDETTKENFEKAGRGIDVLTNRVERLAGREMDPGAVAVASKTLAEDTLEALILSGVGRRAAMGLMADKAFQDGILAQLHAINSVTDGEINALKQELHSLGSVAPGKWVLDPSNVSAELSELQFSLRAVSHMKEYLDDNPEKAAVVGAALILVQAPKAILQTLVSVALLGTSLGEALSEKLGELQTHLGKAVAEHIESEQLNPNENGGGFLIGGGELIVGIVAGSVSGGKKGKETDGDSVSKGKSAKGSGIQNVYDSIRKAPQFPEGFREKVGGTTKKVVNNREALAGLREVESGKWTKIYKDGFDLNGNKVSVHYFKSESGKVFNVKTKSGWSND